MYSSMSVFLYTRVPSTCVPHCKVRLAKWFSERQVRRSCYVSFSFLLRKSVIKSVCVCACVVLGSVCLNE